MSESAKEQSVDRIEQLEARLAAVEAHSAILDLKSRYGTLADARYTKSGPLPLTEITPIAEQLAGLFTDDAVWEGGGALGRCVGREAIFDRFLEPTLLWSWHFFVKPEVRVDGDHATGVWDVLAMMTTLEGRAMWMVGVEHDEYRRVDGRWLHSRMQLDSKRIAAHDKGWGTLPDRTR